MSALAHLILLLIQVMVGYLANAGSNTVSAINTSTHQIIATIPVGFEPFGVAFDSGNKEICS